MNAIKPILFNTDGTACVSAGGSGRRQSMNNWISVKDRLPEDFSLVLVCRKTMDGRQVVDTGCKSASGLWWLHGERTNGVTHWMPMPAPPWDGAT